MTGPGQRPGEQLRRLAAAVCTARALERLIDPAVADLQLEYAAARAQGRMWRARWHRLVHAFALLQVVALHLADRGRHAVRARDARARPAWPTAIATAAVAVSVVTAIMAASTVSQAPALPA